MHSLFGTAQGSNPGPFDSKSDTNNYSTSTLLRIIYCAYHGSSGGDDYSFVPVGRVDVELYERPFAEVEPAPVAA